MILYSQLLKVVYNCVIVNSNFSLMKVLFKHTE